VGGAKEVLSRELLAFAPTDRAEIADAPLRSLAGKTYGEFGPDLGRRDSEPVARRTEWDRRRWLEAALELLAPLSRGERAAVMSDNARRVYRLNMGTS
jgi:hypothetical protein